VNTYECIQKGSLSPNSSSSTAALSVLGISFNLLVEPTAPELKMSDCIYTITEVSTPMRCGVMCGGGVGYGYHYVKQLGLDLSFGQATTSNYSITLSQGAGLVELFWAGIQVYVNSQELAWSTAPPSCVRGTSGTTITYGSDCMTSSSTSITFGFPTNNDATLSEYDVLIISSATALP